MTVVQSSEHEDHPDIDVMQVEFSCHLANVTTLSIGRGSLKAQIAAPGCGPFLNGTYFECVNFALSPWLLFSFWHPCRPASPTLVPTSHLTQRRLRLRAQRLMGRLGRPWGTAPLRPAELVVAELATGNGKKAGGLAKRDKATSTTPGG